MMMEYSRDFDPPAPFMNIIITASKDSEPRRSVGALLDTGAEVSVIPLQIVHELELSPYAEMIIEAFDGRRQRVNLYAVTLEVADTCLSSVRAVAYPTSYAILGRDVLNLFLTILNGPHLSFDITASDL
jgi:predicted aspartyl protease